MTIHKSSLISSSQQPFSCVKLSLFWSRPAIIPHFNFQDFKKWLKIILTPLLIHIEFRLCFLTPLATKPCSPECLSLVCFNQKGALSAKRKIWARRLQTSVIDTWSQRCDGSRTGIVIVPARLHSEVALRGPVVCSQQTLGQRAATLNQPPVRLSRLSALPVAPESYRGIAEGREEKGGG